MIDELVTMWKKTYWPFGWLISLCEELSSVELLNVLVYGFIADEGDHIKKIMEILFIYLLFCTFWEVGLKEMV